MSAALPLADYRDPALVVADAEAGNVLPERKPEPVRCLECPHRRASVGHFGERVWPCTLGNEPATWGGCRRYAADA